MPFPAKTQLQRWWFSSSVSQFYSKFWTTWFILSIFVNIDPLHVAQNIQIRHLFHRVHGSTTNFPVYSFGMLEWISTKPQKLFEFYISDCFVVFVWNEVWILITIYESWWILPIYFWTRGQHIQTSYEFLC